VFEAVYPGGAVVGIDQPSGICFHPESAHDEAVTALAQAIAGNRLLRAFVKRSLIDAPDAKEMNGRKHRGAFRWTRVCASMAMIETVLSACCATAPAHRLLWTGCTGKAQIICFTTAPRGRKPWPDWHRNQGSVVASL
jgi:hypothetical protein